MPRVVESLDLDGYKSEEGFIPSSDVRQLVEAGYRLKNDDYLAILWKGEPMLFLGKQPIKLTDQMVEAIGEDWYITRQWKPYKLNKIAKLPFEGLEWLFNKISNPDYKRDYLIVSPELTVWIGEKSDEDLAFCEWYRNAYFSEFEERNPERLEGLECDVPDDPHPLNSDPIVHFETVVVGGKVNVLQI